MFRRIGTLLLALLLLLLPVAAEAKILLTGTSDLVQVITASAVTTIYVHASWADMTTTALTPGRTNTQVTTAVTTTVVGSPAASTQRQLKILTIRNSHASSSNAVTVQHTDGTTVAELIKYTLLAGETLQYTDDDGFRVIDASGQIKSVVTANAGTNLNTSALATSALQGGGLPAALGAGSGLKVDGSGTALPVSGTVAVSSAPTTAVTGTFWQTTQPVSIATAPVLVAGSAVIGKVGIDQTTPGTTNRVDLGAAIPAGTNLMGKVGIDQTTPGTTNRVDVGAALPAGTNLLGKVGIDQTTPGTTNLVKLTAETTAVIGTVRNVGNVGAAFDAATGAAPPANAILAGGIVSGATGGFMGGIPVCDSQAIVNISTITTTLIVTGVSGRHVRICAFELVTAAANNVAFLSGTGATCGTGTAGMSGGTTAASGYNFAANGGIAHGSGIGTVKKTVATGDSVCLITSATTQLSGSVSYTIH